jgi:hypothetical protein
VLPIPVSFHWDPSWIQMDRSEKWGTPSLTSTADMVLAITSYCKQYKNMITCSHVGNKNTGHFYDKEEALRKPFSLEHR